MLIGMIFLSRLMTLHCLKVNGYANVIDLFLSVEAAVNICVHNEYYKY